MKLLTSEQSLMRPHRHSHITGYFVSIIPHKYFVSEGGSRAEFLVEDAASVGGVEEPIFATSILRTSPILSELKMKRANENLCHPTRRRGDKVAEAGATHFMLRRQFRGSWLPG